MGKRSKVFKTARDCVNILSCPKPNDSLYESNFGLCMLFTTRYKIVNILQSLLNSLYKFNSFNKSELLRFYSLNNIHMFQMKKYSVTANSNTKNDIHYLQRVSHMITTMCSKFSN